MKASGTEPKNGLAECFNFKLGCFVLGKRHDRRFRFSKSASRIKIYYSHLKPVTSRLLIVNTMLPTC
jgi:hypothetical protein